MSVFKSQYTRSLNVIPSDYANVPYPSIINEGAQTSTSSDNLVDENADFIALQVAAGDIVYNTTASLAATVIDVVDANTLLLNFDAFPNEADEYVLYNASSQTSLGAQGCVIYAGGSMSPSVKVTTVGGDESTFPISFSGVIPVQVLKVHKTGTSASPIIALW